MSELEGKIICYFEKDRAIQVACYSEEVVGKLGDFIGYWQRKYGADEIVIKFIPSERGEELYPTEDLFSTKDYGAVFREME